MQSPKSETEQRIESQHDTTLLMRVCADEVKSMNVTLVVTSELQKEESAKHVIGQVSRVLFPLESSFVPHLLLPSTPSIDKAD